MKYTRSFCLKKYNDPSQRAFYKYVCRCHYEDFDEGDRFNRSFPVFEAYIPPRDPHGQVAFTISNFPPGTFFKGELWKSTNSASTPIGVPDIPDGVPMVTENLSAYAHFEFVTLYNSLSTPALVSDDNYYIKYTLSPPSGKEYYVWYFIQEEPLAGEYDQISFDNGVTWNSTNNNQSDGHNSYGFPYSI